MKFVAGIIIAAANANTLNPGKRLIKRFQKVKNNIVPNPKKPPKTDQYHPIKLTRERSNRLKIDRNRFPFLTVIFYSHP